MPVYLNGWKLNGVIVAFFAKFCIFCLTLMNACLKRYFEKTKRCEFEDKFLQKMLVKVPMLGYSCILSSGRSAVWLAHLFWEQGVVSSNPTAPTRK